MEDVSVGDFRTTMGTIACVIPILMYSVRNQLNISEAAFNG